MNDMTLEELTKQAVKEIGVHKKLLQQLRCWFLQLFSLVPRTEIHHDWLTVASSAKRAADLMKTKQTIGVDKKRTMATIQAYLVLAKCENDYAQAWSYINLAEALLPLVVEDNEVDSCCVRLQTWDRLMPHSLKKCLDKTLKEPPRDKKTTSKKKGTSVLSSEDMVKKKHKLHTGLTARALLWNVWNRRISLKLALWRSLTGWLLLSLLVALAIAELAFNQWIPRESVVLHPFAAITVLGFFGGGLSAILKARKEDICMHSHELIEVRTTLRMLLGAAGAFVVFVAVQWVPITNMPVLLNSNPYVFLAVGIAAGFSEKLFIGAIEKIGENLDIAEVTEDVKERDEGERT